MEYSVKKEEVTVNETVLDASSEQPIDIDFMLPDYCPDIQKILKCEVIPQVNSRGISGERLDVEGIVLVKLLYMDSIKNCVKCCEYSSPFSSTFTINRSNKEFNNPLIFIKTQKEYVNCRAISPRKVDIHGAFSIFARVLSKSTEGVVCDIEDDSVEQRKRQIQVSSILGQAQQQFSINEVLELSNGKPSIESIVRTDTVAVVSDTKIISNKLIIKGEALLKILYMSDIENSQMETMEYSIPISQIIDVEGAEDDGICDSRLDVMNTDIQVRSDSSGEDVLLETDIKIQATIICYKETKIQAITDAYSRDYEMELDYQSSTFENLIDIICQTYSYKNMLDTDGTEIGEITDIWNELLTVTSRKENDSILFTGRFNVCLLGTDREGEVLYREKMIDFEYSYNMSSLPLQVKTESDALMLSLGYRITGAKEVEVRADIKLRAAVYEIQNQKAICYAASKEDKPKHKDENTSLILYYADKGECIWDIAREYSTKVQDIIDENNLNVEVLEDRMMLMIPV